MKDQPPCVHNSTGSYPKDTIAVKSSWQPLTRHASCFTFAHRKQHTGEEMSAPSLHDVGWTLLRRAETHDPHRTVEMIAAVDRPPILMWVCPVGRCRTYRYTYHASDPAPLCSGGLPWSFQTTSKFDDE